MHCAAFILALLLAVFPVGGSLATAFGQKGKVIDGIAARVEGDIITESEVRELRSFQQLVEGKAGSRQDVLGELIDQWIVRNEAVNAKYPEPQDADVEDELARLRKQFPTLEAYQTRLVELGLTENAVRRLVRQEIYLTHFLHYKFRPAVQVDRKQVEAYYQRELLPQLQRHSETPPALDIVEERIHEVLAEREINRLSARWLDETKSRLQIDLAPGGTIE
jgi:parvulin-like peptidyl-prolyl isomerase